MFRQALLFIAVKNNLEGENKSMSKVDLGKTLDTYRTSLVKSLLKAFPWKMNRLNLLVLLGFDMIEFGTYLYETLQNIISTTNQTKVSISSLFPLSSRKLQIASHLRKMQRKELDNMEKDVEFSF